MLEKVISGFQTGVDIAAIHAAKKWGLKTGGYMTQGYQTEIGSKPEYSWLYGAVELPTRDYPTRTRRNIETADGTLVFTPTLWSPGTQLTINLCAEALPKPHALVGVGPDGGGGWQARDSAYGPAWIARWIERAGIGTLNVAGPRESKAPGIGEWAEGYLWDVFRLLAEDRGPDPRPVRPEEV